jgi:hypothetical protein
LLIRRPLSSSPCCPTTSPLLKKAF